MPELGADMYCSEQICIPPTYPYLLRQFAKAAIRTQPSDILKWAATYFRCLSLNIPPPVKPRLEYPIPRDHCGLTPGWLKALMYQLNDCGTVTYKILWDRWIGACLPHDNIVKILVLGGFDNNLEIPWLRFMALCAGHLTNNLTETMILICEILTEEPEGGSAMIPIDIFLDLYHFLAVIQASIPQTLRNYYFLDKYLELYREKIIKDAGPPVEEEDVIEEESVTSSRSSTIEMKKKSVDGTSVVSCPSVGSDEQNNFLRLLSKVQEGDEEGYEPDVYNVKSEESIIKSDEGSEHTETEEDVAAEDAVPEESSDGRTTPPEDDEQKRFDQEMDRLQVLQQEMLGESSDDNVQEIKAMQAHHESLTSITEHILDKYAQKSQEPKYSAKDAKKKGCLKPEEGVFEEVIVELVPGIGGIVPFEMVTAVSTYLKRRAATQHNMIMPRNIRHIECPPLHVYD